MVGFRISSDLNLSKSSTGTPSLKLADKYIREVNISYRTTVQKTLHISEKRLLAAFVRSLLSDNIREHSIALFLDKNGNVVHYTLLSIGITDQVYMPRDAVFQRAFAVGADAIVLVHNHPSGTRTPSKADISVAKIFDMTATILGKPILENLIFTEDGLHPYTCE